MGVISVASAAGVVNSDVPRSNLKKKRTYDSCSFRFWYSGHNGKEHTDGGSQAR